MILILRWKNSYLPSSFEPFKFRWRLFSALYFSFVDFDVRNRNHELCFLSPYQNFVHVIVNHVYKVSPPSPSVVGALRSAFALSFSLSRIRKWWMSIKNAVRHSELICFENVIDHKKEKLCAFVMVSYSLILTFINVFLNSN